jgi:diguanylate cyclase (GGDEF)-like protein/PAS domain S-box-containing protein
MRAALHKLGYEVSLASGGEDALRQARSQMFDMVMLDVDMPDMNGYQVCRKLRSEADPLLPIMMVTGMDDVQSVETAFDVGATDFIAKPINWALFGHRVKYLLRGHEVLQDLSAAQAHTDAILGALPDLLFEIDLSGRILGVHSPKTELLAAPVESFIGKTVAEVLPPTVAQTCLSALEEAHHKGVSNGKQYELVLRDVAFWFELSVARKEAPQSEQPQFIVLARDITERKAAEDRIRQLAFYDTLTGLPNRFNFLDQVSREIKRAKHTLARFAVLFMDLDGFKNINDTMGHVAGDLALQAAAAAIQDAVRSVDLVSRARADDSGVQIARLGGDEFTALILDIKSPEDAITVAARILEMVRRPFMLNGKSTRLTTSIGIAVFPEDGDNATDLLKNADSAMYLAKGSGHDQFQFYSASLTELARRHIEMERDLRLALERDEFVLHYQPQVAPRSKHVGSVEALIRWQHPQRGLVSPLEFIPLAEQTGLIVPIGRWVLSCACAQAASWQREGRPLRVAVNLSSVQFKDPDLARHVLETLDQTGLLPQYLELEVTESMLMVNMEATMKTLKAFGEAGLQIALDDFGTGYSSLSYLKRMHLDNIKIDQSFVKELPGDAETLAIVRAILAMAASLGLSVTAEGVETFEQARLLESLGCDLLQGYFFSKPVPAQAIQVLLETDQMNLTRDASSDRFALQFAA